MDTNTLNDATHKYKAKNIKNDGQHVRHCSVHGLAARECVGSCIILCYFQKQKEEEKNILRNFAAVFEVGTTGNAQHVAPGRTRQRAQRRTTQRSDTPQQNTNSAVEQDKTRRQKAQDPRTTDIAPGHNTARGSTKRSKTTQHSAQQRNARQHNALQHGSAQHPGTHHSTRPRHDTRSHQDPPGENRGQPGPTANTQTQQTTTQNTS